jgi:multicomponent K+:H+ antiporter subunit G
MNWTADNAIVEVLMVVLLAIGSFFVLVGSIGLVKLSEFFKRLHGPTKATTLGVGCILIASIAWHALLGDGLGLRELLITLFLFITAPISAHLMARAALASTPGDRPDPPRDEARAARDGAPEDAGEAAREGGPPRD